MSGAAGGVAIKKEDLKDTIRDYRDNVLKPLNLDTSYKVTGVRSRPSKSSFGDIDIVVSFPGGDKKQLKKDLAGFLEGVDEIPQMPHKSNKKSFIHGQIVTTLWPIANQTDEYIQIDNIVTTSEDEGEFTYGMLDLPAQEQGLVLGLAKTIFSELDQNEIQQLFKNLNIPEDIEKPQEGEEYDFNLNTSGLSLKISPIKGKSGRVVWTSNNFQDVKSLVKSLGIDIEKDDFDTIVEKIKSFKSRRSIDRLKGMFARNIRVGPGEVGKEKGIQKQKALDKVAMLEEKYGSLAVELIKPITTEGEKDFHIALMPGAFKPPHRDHLTRINAAANIADKVIILISPLDRSKPGQEPISAQQSLNIWNLYKSKGVLNNNVEFEISKDNSPVKTSWDIVRDNPNQEHIVIYGKGEDKRWRGIKDKFDNVEISDLGLDLNLASSDFRTALLNDEDISKWLPNGITPEEYKQALNPPTSLSEGISSKALFSTLLERENNIVAFFGGGFKPPIKSHFIAVKKILENHPEVDKVSIVIGKGLEDNISQDEAYSIWNIYKNYLPLDKIEIIKADNTPLSYITKYVKNNTDHKSYIIIGSKEDQDDEMDRFSQEKDIFDKYGDHVEIKHITSPNSVSGEKAREAANISQDQFNRFLPDELTDEEKNTVYSYVQSAIQEGRAKKKKQEVFDKFKEAWLSQKDDFKGFQSLVKKFLNKEELTSDERKQFRRNLKDILKLSTLPVLGATLGTLLGYLTNKITKGKFSTLPSKFKDKLLNEDDQPIYSAIFFNQDELKNKYIQVHPNLHAHHSTIEFKPKNISNLPIGAEVDIEVLGRLTTDKVDVLIVDNNFSKKKYPHITLSTADGVKPVESNQEIEDNLDKVIMVKDYLKGVVGVYPNKTSTSIEEIKENKDPFGLNEFVKELMKEEQSFDIFDYPKYIKSLTKFMLDTGLNLNPLPNVKFINDDVENAGDFFGKTAYYDPNSHRIVLYTLNRHPKDVMRSFAHEMIHHMQNCEDRLGNITHQNTNQDDHLDGIEREAYEKGNICFRNWTDTLTEGVLKEGKYDAISNQISSNIFRQWKDDFNKGLTKSTYTDTIDSQNLYFDLEATIEYTPELDTLKVDGFADNGDEDKGYDPFLKVDFKINPKLLPKFWYEISMNLKDVVRHEIEHLTQSGENVAGGYYPDPKDPKKFIWKGKGFEDDTAERELIEKGLLAKSRYFKLAREVDAMLQGLYFRAKKEKNMRFKDVVNRYLDHFVDKGEMTPQEKEEILDLWRTRLSVLGLPKL